MPLANKDKSATCPPSMPASQPAGLVLLGRPAHDQMGREAARSIRWNKPTGPCLHGRRHAQPEGVDEAFRLWYNPSVRPSSARPSGPARIAPNEHRRREVARLARPAGELHAGETPEVGMVLVDSDTRELRVSSEFRLGHTVRAFVREAAEECDLGTQAVADLMLAVTEIFNNAVEHAHRFEAHREVLIRVHRRQGALQVDITDQGPGFTPLETSSPASFFIKQRGLGLFLARQLVDEIRFSHGAGTTVHLVKIAC